MSEDGSEAGASDVEAMSEDEDEDAEEELNPVPTEEEESAVLTTLRMLVRGATGGPSARLAAAVARTPRTQRDIPPVDAELYTMRTAGAIIDAKDKTQVGEAVMAMFGKDEAFERFHVDPTSPARVLGTSVKTPGGRFVVKNRPGSMCCLVRRVVPHKDCTSYAVVHMFSLAGPARNVYVWFRSLDGVTSTLEQLALNQGVQAYYCPTGMDASTAKKAQLAPFAGPPNMSGVPTGNAFCSVPLTMSEMQFCPKAGTTAARITDPTARAAAAKDETAWRTTMNVIAIQTTQTLSDDKVAQLLQLDVSPCKNCAAQQHFCVRLSTVDGGGKTYFLLPTDVAGPWTGSLSGGCSPPNGVLLTDLTDFVATTELYPFGDSSNVPCFLGHVQEAGKTGETMRGPSQGAVWGFAPGDLKDKSACVELTQRGHPAVRIPVTSGATGTVYAPKLSTVSAGVFAALRCATVPRPADQEAWYTGIDKADRADATRREAARVGTLHATFPGGAEIAISPTDGVASVVDAGPASEYLKPRAPRASPKGAAGATAKAPAKGRGKRVGAAAKAPAKGKDRKIATLLRRKLRADRHIAALINGKKFVATTTEGESSDGGDTSRTGAAAKTPEEVARAARREAASKLAKAKKARTDKVKADKVKAAAAAAPVPPPVPALRLPAHVAAGLSVVLAPMPTEERRGILADAAAAAAATPLAEVVEMGEAHPSPVVISGGDSDSDIGKGLENLSQSLPRAESMEVLDSKYKFVDEDEDEDEAAAAPAAAAPAPVVVAPAKGKGKKRQAPDPVVAAVVPPAPRHKAKAPAKAKPAAAAKAKAPAKAKAAAAAPAAAPEPPAKRSAAAGPTSRPVRLRTPRTFYEG